MSNKPLNPGSDAAIAAGCKCPVLDNNRGAGIRHLAGDDPTFWVNAECPMHGYRKAEWTQGVNR